MTDQALLQLRDELVYYERRLKELKMELVQELQQRGWTAGLQIAILPVDLPPREDS